MINLNPALPQAAPSDSTTTTSGSGLPTSQGLNDMFMQLLMAQLKNQSPLDPMDPTQFVGQLAQFSELSEVTQIEQLLQQQVGATSGSGATTPATGGKSPAPDTNPAPAATSSPVLSSAASAAQTVIPKFASSAASFFNHQIQGVF